jgi:hypothetical protein
MFRNMGYERPEADETETIRVFNIPLDRSRAFGSGRPGWVVPAFVGSDRRSLGGEAIFLP